jgi:hypothetical protein
MIDDEVMRLRRLRRAALCTRALARAFGAAGRTGDAALFDRAACACWRIARAVSGRLIAHPYLGYQKGASPVAALWDGALARASAALTGERVRRSSSFTRSLRVISRELDDARALTRSTDLNDILGRSQSEFKTLIGAFQNATLREPAQAHIRSEFESGGAVREHSGDLVPTELVEDWPFLTI